MSRKVIEEHAKRVATRTIPKLISTTIANKTLNELLQPYTTNKNQYIFLKALRREAEHALFEHRNKCKRDDCAQVIGYEYLNFAIEQELETIATHYSPGDDGNDEEFSTQEKTIVNAKIDQVLDNLNKLNLGQQIIFEEINELREHFQLSKKNWVQLLKGKLIDMGTEKVIEATVLNMIYETLSESLKEGQFLLPK